jgi:hypothetical protein
MQFGQIEAYGKKHAISKVIKRPQDMGFGATNIS